MTAIQAIAVVLIRLWAIGALIMVIRYAPWLLEDILIQDSPTRELNVIAISNFFISLFAGVGGLLFSRSLARMISPQFGNDTLRVNVGADQLMALGSFVIGAIYLVGVLPKIIAKLSVLAFTYKQYDQSPFSSIGRLDSIAEILTVILALGLMISASRVGRFFSGLREVGLYSGNEDDPSEER